MTKLEQLYDLAYRRNICIYDFHISKTKKAACLYNNQYKAVALDKPRISNASEERVILAEEIGHYETNSLYLLEATHNTPLAQINHCKREALAKRWAIKTQLPRDTIKAGVEAGCNNIYELADYCDVPGWFLERAVEYYKNK